MVDPTQPDAAAQRGGGARARRAARRSACSRRCTATRFTTSARSGIFDGRGRAAPGTAVFVHCGVLSVGVRKKLGLPSPFDIRFGNPLDLHAVALAYPPVPIIVPHFGAGLFREALMVADLCPNVLLDTSSSNGWIKYQPGLTLAAVLPSGARRRRRPIGCCSAPTRRSFRAAG